MFETQYPANWERVNEMIERRYLEERLRSRLRVEKAHIAVLRILGYDDAFINRSIAQRRRFRLQRQLEGVTQWPQ